jgi:isopenicillin N synthase-like dioxygenase
METLNQKGIRTLDFSLWKSGQKEEFANQLKESFQTTGFCLLKNHGIPIEKVDTALNLYKKFFLGLLPYERLRYERKEEKHQIGYTPLGIETGEYAKDPDVKHFFQFRGHENIDSVPELPGLIFASVDLFSMFRNLSIEILRAVAVSLWLTEDYFDLREGNSVMRAIHYPAHSSPVTDDEIVAKGGNHIGMCASKHTDINMLTLLFARQKGLELQTGDGWMPVVTNNPDEIILNCGDMLEHLTAGVYKSGVHRVVCERNTDRFSIPYFCHIKEKCSIRPLASFEDLNNGRFKFKTAGEFLNHRLNKINL